MRLAKGDFMITYTKLWILLENKGMKRTELKKVISGNTLAKLGKNEPVSITVIEKICNFLNCQPGDIMENVTEEDIQKAGEVWNKAIADTLEMLSLTTGMSKEAILDEFQKEVPNFMEKLKSGEPDVLGLGELMNKSGNVGKGKKE